MAVRFPPEARVYEYRRGVHRLKYTLTTIVALLMSYFAHLFFRKAGTDYRSFCVGVGFLAVTLSLLWSCWRYYLLHLPILVSAEGIGTMMCSGMRSFVSWGEIEKIEKFRATDPDMIGRNGGYNHIFRIHGGGDVISFDDKICNQRTLLDQINHYIGHLPIEMIGYDNGWDTLDKIQRAGSKEERAQLSKERITILRKL